MPPAILADSDDDGEDHLDPPSPTIAMNLASPLSPYQEGPSTGSTERLRGKLLEAQDDLLAPSGGPAAAMDGACDSPTVVGTKRGHTDINDTEQLSSLGKPVKRIKTVQTYSERHSSIISNTDDAIAVLQDNAEIQQASSEGRFTEHSGMVSSISLPVGLLQVDFATHEPTVMFPDSGSTEVDGSATQRQLLEQALGGTKENTTSRARPIELEDPRSSSFPWSASAQTPTTKDSGGSTGDANPPGLETRHVDVDAQNECEQRMTAQEYLQDGSVQLVTNVPTEAPGVDEDTAPAIVGQVSAEEFNLHANHSSPIVAIYTNGEPVNMAPPNAQITSSLGKGRKRKSQAPESGPLNSEDLEIGLPKERYVPRPSKRRATEIIVEPIDYSVRPERAAKVKRAKTTTAMMDIACHPQSGTAVPEGSNKRRSTDASPLDVTEDDLHAEIQVASKEGRDASVTSGVAANEEKLASTSTMPADTDSAPKGDLNDDIFVKPLPKVKTKSKSKRSHTTIFEDHIDYHSSQQQPSLSQQQARRKVTLGDCESVKISSDRKQRHVLEECDDDSDANPCKVSAEENDDGSVGQGMDGVTEHSGQVMKKRRGRPPKEDSLSSSKSRDLTDTGTDVQGQVSLHAGQEKTSEDDTATKKRGRVKPAKQTTQLQQDTFSTTTEQQAPEESGTACAEYLQDSVAGPNASVDGAAATVIQTAKNAPQQQPPPTTQNTTPTPEEPGRKPPAAAGLTPTVNNKVVEILPKSSPISHSPIKGSSKVPFRVGLSKRQRIPPLLRVVKPTGSNVAR